ncbi:FUSC family protein [Kitasatospora sp. CB01950]|uniref:FUSC family protein n=1 Tax=Kitasatospora sp. CB01950 TaxID=1703930 RepID=UPI001F5299D6|nr:FUSC family protein [Kitasatospora sp. CB01950]
MSTQPSTTPPARRIPLPPLRQVLRLGTPADIWHKPAVSAVVAVGAVNLTLLALGRLDLALYTMAGCLCALYGHGLPYPARARTLAAVAAGTVLSTAVALTAASLTHSAAVLVAVCAVLAALHKLACEAGRVGPPGALIVTFTSTTCAFVPQRLADLPAHLALTALGAAVAWLVCMAPALVRPFGPERILTARALEAAARLLSGEPDRRPAARTALAAAVNAARHTLVPDSAPAVAEPRRRTVAGLERLLVRSESALASTPARHDTDADTARRYQRWARDLRRNRPLPAIELTAAEAAELRDAAEAAAAAARRPSRWHALRPGSPLLPITLRVALGCAAAGWASMALGVGRPGWAVVTAASIYQASAGLSWQRALQRVLGNLLGLLVFTALLPVSRTGQLALVLIALACNFATEATIARSYWLASAFVTPMALLMTEFAGHQDARTMVADRWLDTCLGALFGLAACLVVTNRRTSTRLDRALAALLAATESARTAVADAPTAVAARRRLSHALVELREATDIASGEWWQRVLPQRRIAQAEREGHGQLAAMLDRRSGCEPSPACP